MVLNHISLLKIFRLLYRSFVIILTKLLQSKRNIFNKLMCFNTIFASNTLFMALKLYIYIYIYIYIYTHHNTTFCSKLRDNNAIKISNTLNKKSSNLATYYGGTLS